MPTSVVSGRVDERVRQRADAFIRGAGTTPAEVIKVTWERIARTGEVPVEEGAQPAQKGGAWDRLMRLRDELPARPELAAMTDEQMRDMIARRYGA